MRGEKTGFLWKKQEYRDHMSRVHTKYNIDVGVLKAEYLSGISTTKLSEYYGCEVHGIIKRLKKAGITKFRRGFQKGHRGYSGFLGRKHNEEAKKKIGLSKLGANNPNYKNAKISFICEGCGNKFSAYNNNVRKFKYCSNRCQMKHSPTMKGVIGRNHPAWRENKRSPLKKSIRGSHNYGKWRSAVFKRDNYT